MLDNQKARAIEDLQQRVGALEAALASHEEELAALRELEQATRVIVGHDDNDIAAWHQLRDAHRALDALRAKGEHFHSEPCPTCSGQRPAPTLDTVLNAEFEREQPAPSEPSGERMSANRFTQIMSDWAERGLLVSEESEIMHELSVARAAESEWKRLYHGCDKKIGRAHV